MTFIDIHALQTLPYSCVNRDDLGSPKTVRFGGKERTRVSSQSWKRALRFNLESRIDEAAYRTRKVSEAVSRLLVEDGWSKELAEKAGRQVVVSAASNSGLKEESDGSTSALLYLPTVAIRELAELAKEHREAIEAAGEGKKAKAVLPSAEINNIFSSRNGIINLMGRMLAELPSANVDGAVQVAHAFTTHETAPQVDFFTAVDDLGEEWKEDAGSAHMNSAEFTSGVFYRYATLALDDLMSNLGEDPGSAKELSAAFLNAFVTSMPEAKKTSTAPHSIPDLVYVAVRQDRPLSLAAAFEKPVQFTAEGWSAPSRDQMSDYATRAHRLFGTDGLVYHAHAGVDDKALDGLGESMSSFSALIDGALRTALPAS